MGRRFSRHEILKRLKETADRKVPILGSGCSAGIIAKFAELGGTDLIIVYSTGLSRIKGFKTTLIPDSNRMTLGMYQELANVVKDTPMIAGVEATEFPTEKSLPEIIKPFIDIGFSGIINFPTVARFDDEELLSKDSQVEDRELAKVIEEHLYREKLEYSIKKAGGLDFSKEVEMIRLCRNVDIFTMSYVFTPEQAREMAKAGTDCIVAHAGGTAGGAVGFGGRSHEEAAARLQEIYEEAKKINTSVICLGHGGPFADPDDTRYLYEHTDAIGFVGASSIERIPVERAIKTVVEEFKSIPLHNKQ